MADIWYPAEYAQKVNTSYLDTSAFYHAFGVKGLQSFLGQQGAALIRSHAVRTHASEDADFDHNIKAAPVVFFSHGMGMITQHYTAQIEDLACHGYVVVALTHPYDAWLVSFIHSVLNNAA